MNQSTGLSTGVVGTFLGSSLADSIPTAGIDFGYCGIQQTASKSLTLYNPNSVGSGAVSYQILTDNCPFVFTQLSGTIAPRQKQEITITFTPEEAKVVIATVIFKLSGGQDDGVTKVLKLSAIGKYPFLTVNHEKFDFETLLVGKVTSKDVVLKNSSLVPAKFSLQKVNDDGKDLAFSIDEYSGVVPPGSTFKITVKFVPTVVGLTSCVQYKVQTVGGNDLSFSCIGHAEGYNVSLSVKSMHFGEVQLASNTNRLLNIINDSELPTTFQFFTDDKNVFSFSKIEGTVNAKSQTRIIVTFTPQTTTNYYERVFCVVRNHSVLYVDLIGTCYDILTKPVPLMQRHVDIYRHKVIMGIHNKSRGNKMLTDGSEAGSTSLEDELDLMHEIAIDDPNQVVIHKEMFLEQASENRDLKLREEYVDFGFTEYGRVSEQKQITMDNKFPFDIQVSWVLLKIINATTGLPIENPFKVSPAQTVIPANSSFQFNVRFAPHVPDSYFFQIAQCFIQLVNGCGTKTKRMAAGTLQSQTSKTAAKTLLSSMKKNKFEEALNEELDPPACINLRLVAHSFPPGSQPFIPMVKISPSNKITFPPASMNESVYQTVQIVNTSDTPVYYKILGDTTKTFRAYPPMGLITGKSFGLVCFEFQPKQARFYNFTAQCIFNHSASNIQSLHLVGHCYQPHLEIGNDQKLFYPPTYTGVSSKQKISIKNESRIPLSYEWKVPEKYKTEIFFEPQKSLLMPNEETKISCTFTPLKKREYILSVPIYAQNLFDHLRELVGFYNPGSGLLRATGGLKTLTQAKESIVAATQSIRYDIEVIGAGSDGVLSLNPKDIDFGTITVGFAKTMSVTVINKSNCNLYIELQMVQRVEEDGKISKETEAVPLMKKILKECFKFDQPKGLLNAKSKKKVNITFKPSLRFNFDINLVCVAREKMAKEIPTMTKDSKPDAIVEKSFIKIKATGDYPLLRVTDVRNEQISTAFLWERFRLTTMNKELIKPLNESEQVFNNSEKSNQSVQDLQRNLKNFTWDFGKIPIKYGSKPRRVTLSLKNIGGVPADWTFKMPNDNEIELEPWADPGEPTEEQAFERHILEKGIFNVEPRKGSLAPGEQMDVTVSYFPREVKLHYLKVFFQIVNGKPLIINLQGETLHRRAQLQLLKDVYHLPPVPIGIEWAVTYPIEIKNLGITKLKYSIDTQLLEKLNKENYDFRIFEIQNPEGTLLANETQFIYTLFRPLEAKEYSLDLPIRVSDIEGPSPVPYTLKLRGSGYHFEEKKPKEIAFYEDLPKCRSNLSDAGALAAFSLEEIDFGELDQDELSRRFVILYNLHPTQRLRFDFAKSGLMCGDNIKLEPMSGELKPNSHLNIKMTLVSSRYPTHFEGEIQCQIDWESEGDNTKMHDVKSIQTTTVISEIGEFLFLRLRKRSKITMTPLTMENRETDPLVDNFLIEAMNEIMESEDLEKALNDCETRPNGLFSAHITNEQAPNFETILTGQASSIDQEPPTEFRNQNTQRFEEELKLVSGVADGTAGDSELFRKRMFLENNFVGMLEYMLEDTLFNLMEEATYEEFDLTQAPKIYIRKEGGNSSQTAGPPSKKK